MATDKKKTDPGLRPPYTVAELRALGVIDDGELFVVALPAKGRRKKLSKYEKLLAAVAASNHP